MLFKNLIGHQAIQQQLLNLEAHNRLSHTILFIGREGCGALPLAVGFGQYLVSKPIEKTKKPVEAADLFGGFSAIPGETTEADPNPQNESLEHKAEALLHPDLHFSYPVVPRKPGATPVSTDYIQEWRKFYQETPYGNAFEWIQTIQKENKQGNITAEECNDIIRKLSLKAYESRFKVLVMWMPEYLGKEGNKLLKLLEEPPEDTVFLLVAENEDQVLPTIVSRSQVIRVPPYEIADIENALVSQYKLSGQEARQIALISDGNYREALQLMEHEQEDWNEILKEWLNACLLKTASHLRFDMQTKSVARLAELGREKQKQVLLYLLQLIEQAIRIRIMGADKITLPEKEMEFTLKLNKIAGINTQRAMVQELENAIYYIERNANAKMLFQGLTLKLRSIVLEKTIVLSN